MRIRALNMPKFASLLGLLTVAYASRVRTQVAEGESHADAHSADFNPGVVPVSPDLDGRSWPATRWDASQHNLRPPAMSVQDPAYHPKLRPDWTYAMGDFSTHDLDFDDRLSSPGKTKAELLPVLTRSLSAPRPRSRGVRDPIMSAAVLQRPVLERAPPAPPPGNNVGRGRGGGDGDGNKYWRRITDSEAVGIIDDWIARARIYSMTGQFGNVDLAEVHKKSLNELEAFRSFCQYQDQRPFTSLGQIMPNRILGVFSEEPKKVWALAGAFLDEEKKALVLKHMSVNPVENNDEDSIAALSMKYGLLQYIRILWDDDIEWIEDITDGED